jgi:signal transduction histidine kinase
VEIVREQPGAPLMVPLAADRMQQVFLNLILNAADAMMDGGELRVGVSRTEAPRGVTITFADTGPGIPAESIGKLFEPFFSTKEGGVGLGLYISRNIIEQHGGRISVHSVPAEGTHVEIWIPED